MDVKIWNNCGSSYAVGALVGFILGGLAPWKLAGAGIGAAWGAGIGLGMGTLAAGAITKFGTAGDVFSPADGKTQVSTKEGGLYELSKNDDFMAGPGIASGGGAPVVNIDLNPLQESTMKMVELMQQRNEQAENQSRKGIRATEGAFANR